jgi:hypothetical protein
VTYERGGLVLTMRAMRDHDPRSGHEDEPVRSAIHPIAPHRFLPENDAITSHHTWDIAFAPGADGRADLLHNGAFAARRTT